MRSPLLLLLVFAAAASAVSGEWFDAAIVLAIVLMARRDPSGPDFMVVQGVSPAQRGRGVRGPILGNGKVIGGAPWTQQSQEPEV